MSLIMLTLPSLVMLALLSLVMLTLMSLVMFTLLSLVMLIVPFLQVTPGGAAAASGKLKVGDRILQVCVHRCTHAKTCSET